MIARGKYMLPIGRNLIRRGMVLVLVVAGLAMIVTQPASAGKKKKPDQPADSNTPTAKWVLEHLDYSKIVWPNPPAIARLRYMDTFSAEKFEASKAAKQKSAWMDRLSGVATGETRATKPHFQLVTPYGVAVDSKARLYVADEKVGAIFVFDTESKDVELIKNGLHARFNLITGLAIDDGDRLFVSDSVARRILVFDPKHRKEGTISEGMSSPAGLAIDNTNRFLYVADSELDQVLVYDADPPYKLLRTLGHRSKDHELTEPGDFSRPTNVAVDGNGNLYVADTFNNRVEVFDPEGGFIRTFGKAGDGPGYFARPKGIAVDKDGHVWVADSVQDRVQVFTPEGRLLLWMGGHGNLPGQFSALAGLTIDKNNRVFTSEQYPGRVQMFRYVTNEEAQAEKMRRDAEAQKAPIGTNPTAPSEGAPQKDAANVNTSGSGVR